MSESNEVLPPERVRAAVRVLVRLRRVMERADTGITLPQYQLLALVGLRGERSARLAERLAVRKPTVTATADGLVAAGLLERHAEDGDRRVVRLRLTETGLAAADRAEQALADAVGPLLAATGDPGALLDLLDAVGEALDQRFEERHQHGHQHSHHHGLPVPAAEAAGEAEAVATATTTADVPA